MARKQKKLHNAYTGSIGYVFVGEPECNTKEEILSRVFSFGRIYRTEVMRKGPEHPHAVAAYQQFLTARTRFEKDYPEPTP